jgi:hypothetical protein
MGLVGFVSRPLLGLTARRPGMARSCDDERWPVLFVQRTERGPSLHVFISVRISPGIFIPDFPLWKIL